MVKVALSNNTIHTKHYLQNTQCHVLNCCCSLGQLRSSNACIENNNKLSFHSLYKVSILFFANRGITTNYNFYIMSIRLGYRNADDAI